MGHDLLFSEHLINHHGPDPLAEEEVNELGHDLLLIEHVIIHHSSDPLAARDGDGLDHGGVDTKTTIHVIIILTLLGHS